MKALIWKQSEVSLELRSNWMKLDSEFGAGKVLYLREGLTYVREEIDRTCSGLEGELIGRISQCSCQMLY